MAADFDSGKSVVCRMRQERRGAAVVLWVAGELDLGSASQVQQTILDALRHQPSVLVADLSGLTFLSAAGLNVLVRAHRASGLTTHVRIVPGERGRRVLELAQLTSVLPTYPDLARALAA